MREENFTTISVIEIHKLLILIYIWTIIIIHQNHCNRSVILISSTFMPIVTKILQIYPVRILKCRPNFQYRSTSAVESSPDVLSPSPLSRTTSIILSRTITHNFSLPLLPSPAEITEHGSNPVIVASHQSCD